MLSPPSVAVLLFSVAFAERRRNWLDKSTDPLDQVTDADWEIIENLTATLNYEVMNPMIGLIVPVATEVLPANMLPLDGTIYDAVDYPQLYAVIADSLKLSGDRFVLPDLAGLSFLSSGTSPVSGNAYVRGAIGGAETVTLSTAQIPAHTHSIPLVTNGLAVSPGELPVVVPLSPLTDVTGSTGGGGSHTNMPPYAVLLYGVIAF